MINDRYSAIVNNVGDFIYHVLGCGAIGSSAAIQLVRMGAKEIILYDFDKVEDANIGVSQYTQDDVGLYKVNALQKHLKSINPDVVVITHNSYFDEWESSDKTDIVILGFDSMHSRLKAVETISKKGKSNMPYALIDGRM
jgi:molybdopterin/thiamine biosynthesis adenylyltransferase